MVNYQGRYIQNVSDKTVPLKILLEDKYEFMWTDQQDKCFKELKEMLSTEPILKFYDPNKNIKISLDSSKAGLVAVLLQK